MIDPKQAGKILDADMVNIVKRAAAGKPLTPAQRKLVEQSKEPKERVSIHSLALQFGLDRFTVRKRLVQAGLMPPDKFPMDKLIESMKPERKAGTFKDKKEYEDWRKVKLQNDFKECKLVLVERVIARDSKLIAAVRGLLSQKLLNEYPSQVAGQDAAHAREYGKKLEDQLLAEFSRFAETWKV